MLLEDKDSIQVLNTAIIKSKEKKIDSSFEEKLAKTCQTPAIRALAIAVAQLADSEKISRDVAAMMIVETVRELDQSWNDYLMIEGLEKIKETLKNKSIH